MSSKLLIIGWLMLQKLLATPVEKTSHRDSSRYVISTGDLGFYDESFDDVDGWNDRSTSGKTVKNEFFSIKKRDSNNLKSEYEDAADDIADNNHNNLSENITNETVSSEGPIALEHLVEEYNKQVKNESNAIHLQNKEPTKETIKQSLEGLIKVGNCTDERPFDLGFKAYTCLNKSNLTSNAKILRNLALTWAFIATGVALCLWCKKGWCCCCWPCGLCKIAKRTEMIKEFLAENPPGQWKEGNNIYNYEPSEKEVYIYERMLYNLLTL